MRSIAFVFLLLTAALAGCSNDPEDDPGTSTTSSSTTSSSRSASASTSRTASSSSTTTTSSAANQAPTGAVAVSLNGTQASFTLTGTDADGDALTWTLSFGDGSANATGGALPAQVNHTYDAGNFTATFVLSDGRAFATYNATLNATASPTGPVQTVTGSFPLGGPLAECNLGSYLGAPFAGVTYSVFDVDPATYGKPFVFRMTATVPPVPDGTFLGELGDGVGIDFIDAAGDYIDSFGGDVGEDITGTVTDGAPRAAAWACGGASLSFTYAAG